VKKKSPSRPTFFNLRVLIYFALFCTTLIPAEATVITSLTLTTAARFITSSAH
jgi:hypothetical protein